MHLPTHIVLNALVLSRRKWRSAWKPILIGAVLPDIPLFVFYLRQRLLLGRTEEQIWSIDYFQNHWQYAFDLFHSIPLIGISAFLAWVGRKSLWLVLFLSMLMHAFFDLLLHNDDAHSHFVSFVDWRFHSPVSYWDARFYGQYVAAAEIILVLVGAFILARRGGQWRILGIGVMGLGAGLALMIWTLWL